MSDLHVSAVNPTLQPKTSNLLKLSIVTELVTLHVLRSSRSYNSFESSSPWPPKSASNFRSCRRSTRQRSVRRLPNLLAYLCALHCFFSFSMVPVWPLIGFLKMLMSGNAIDNEPYVFLTVFDNIWFVFPHPALQRLDVWNPMQVRCRVQVCSWTWRAQDTTAIHHVQGLAVCIGCRVKERKKGSSTDSCMTSFKFFFFFFDVPDNDVQG